MSSQQNRDRSSIAMRLAVAASLMIVGAAAQADTIARPVLTGYSDKVQSDGLQAGEYKSLVAEVARYKDAPTITPAAYATNECVTFIAARQMDAAKKACDAAVHNAKRERIQLSSWAVTTRKAYNEQIAIAYANRAVMYYLANDPEKAAQDLVKAEDLAPSAGYVTQNLAAMSIKGTVAQAK